MKNLSQHFKAGKFLLLIFFAITLFTSCEEDKRRMGMLAEENVESIEMAPRAVTIQDMSPNDADEPLTIDRKLIMEGSINFETNSVKDTREQLTAEVEKLKGYISNENTFNQGDRIQYDMTIRVPADNFTELLKFITSHASRIENKSINVLDVTEEYVDIESRIKTKKEIEARYRELLKQAKDVEDILAIERELGKLREEIESVEGRLKYLKNKIGYSTLNVSYFERTGADFGFGSRFISGIRNGWENLLWFMIGLVHIWPFLLILGIGVFLLVRFLRRKRS